MHVTGNGCHVSRRFLVLGQALDLSKKTFRHAYTGLGYVSFDNFYMNTCYHNNFGSLECANPEIHPTTHYEMWNPNHPGGFADLLSKPLNL